MRIVQGRPNPSGWAANPPHSDAQGLTTISGYLKTYEPSVARIVRAVKLFCYAVDLNITMRTWHM